MSRPHGARSLYEYCLCLAVLRGTSEEIERETARRTIHNTPKETRSAFAREIAQRRRERGTDTRGVQI